MIQPTIRVESTISDPLNPASVIGFHGRDPRIGQNVVMMKQSAVEDFSPSNVGEAVKLPADATETIANHDAALFVLNDDTVLKMTPAVVAGEAVLEKFEEGNRSEEMSIVSLESDNFHRFDRDEVEIKN